MTEPIPITTLLALRQQVLDAVRSPHRLRPYSTLTNVIDRCLAEAFQAGREAQANATPSSR
jgi:hypothetical protein